MKRFHEIGIFLTVIGLWSSVATAKEVAIKKEHPRIWLTEALRKQLREKYPTPEEARESVGGALGAALAYQLSGKDAVSRDAKFAQEAGNVLRGNVRNSRDFIAYDWAFEGLSEEDRKATAEKIFQKINRYNNLKDRLWRTFDADTYGAALEFGLGAIAICHDHPQGEALFQMSCVIWWDTEQALRNVFPDGSAFEGFDYNRHATFNMAQYAAAHATATGDNWIRDNSYYHGHVYYMIYMTYPDRRILNSDDCDLAHITDWEGQTLYQITGLFRDPYGMEYIKQYAEGGRSRELKAIFLPRDLQSRPFSELPKARLFRGKGLVISRSGWGADDTLMTFRCGDYYGDHCHLDVGNFVIYKKGAVLVPDTGVYDDEGWSVLGSPKARESQFLNYFRRTVAHNTILVYDPEEKFAGYEKRVYYLNDGGQRDLLHRLEDGERWVPANYERPYAGHNYEVLKPYQEWFNTGDIVAYEDTEAFTYVAGDCTMAYGNPKTCNMPSVVCPYNNQKFDLPIPGRSRKMKRFVRQWVFLRPDTLVLFDQVETTKPEYKKTWLIHSANAPTIEGNRFKFSEDEATLNGITLLPGDAELKPITGFVVEGVELKHTSKVNRGDTPGPNRIEVSPKAAATQDCFLHVLDVSGKAPEAALDESEDSAGVKLKIGGKAVKILFLKGEKVGGSIELDGKWQEFAQEIKYQPFAYQPPKESPQE